MSVLYDEKSNIFALQTENTSYVFSVYSEKPNYENSTERRTLRSLYWGKKINNINDFIRPFDWQINGCNDGGKHSHERYCSEYVGSGGMFYCEPTLKVDFSDGVRDLFLNVSGHNVEGNTLTVTLKDVTYPIEIDLIYRVVEDKDLIERNCVIRNTGKENIIIEKAFSATVNIPYGGEVYLTSLGSKWTHEYREERSKITGAKTVIQSSGGVSNSQNYPYFAIDKGETGRYHGDLWFGTLKWSGNFKITVERDPMEQVRITGGISDDDFCIILAPSDEFATPVFVFGYTANGVQSASHKLNSYVYSIMPQNKWTNKPLPIIYNSWCSLEYNINAENVEKTADLAAKIGAECFVIDDGWMINRVSWQGGLGDWIVDPVRFPNGLTSIIKKVNSLGMMFGIWVEPEMVSRDSELYAEHPDWVLGFETREQEESRCQLVLNLAREDVAQYLIKMLDDLLSNNNIEYLKWDMNRYISQAAWKDAPFDNQKMVWVKYVENLYRIYDSIVERHPDVLFENCASGGLRCDIGTMQYSQRINITDNHDPVDELYMREGYTRINPWSTIGGAGHITKNRAGFNCRECPLKYKALLGMTGSLGIGIDLTLLNEEELNEIAGYVSLAKEVRSTVQFGTPYILSSVKNDGYMAVEFVSKDKTEAYIFIFAPMNTFAFCTPCLPLHGLITDAIYSVDGKYCMSGEGLMNRGIDAAVHTLGNMGSKLIHIIKEN